MTMYFCGQGEASVFSHIYRLYDISVHVNKYYCYMTFHYIHKFSNNTYPITPIVKTIQSITNHTILHLSFHHGCLEDYRKEEIKIADTRLVNVTIVTNLMIQHYCLSPIDGEYADRHAIQMSEDPFSFSCLVLYSSTYSS